MFIEAERRVFLDGVQVGEFVCVVRRRNEWRVHAVTKTSAARIWIGDTQFDRKTGQEWGSASSFYCDSIYQLTADRVDAARVELERAKEQTARKVLLASINPVLGSAPLSTLEQIRAILAQVPTGNQ